MRRGDHRATYLDTDNENRPRVWYTRDVVPPVVPMMDRPRIRKCWNNIGSGASLSPERRRPNLDDLYRTDVLPGIGPHLTPPMLMRRVSSAPLFMAHEVEQGLKLPPRFRKVPELLKDKRYCVGMQVMSSLQRDRFHKKRFPPSLSPQKRFSKTYTDAYSEIEEQKKMEFLHNLFLATDADGSGYIDLDEFVTAVSNSDATKLFATFGIQPHEAIKIFKSMAGDSGICNVQQFMRGLTQRKTQFDKECALLSGY